MTVKTKKIIMVELVETNVFSRWHCTVCDGCTNPVSVLAEGKDGCRATIWMRRTSGDQGVKRRPVAAL
jgi:hypothetical protein